MSVDGYALTGRWAGRRAVGESFHPLRAVSLSAAPLLGASTALLNPFPDPPPLYLFIQVLASYTALLQLNVTGVWGVKVLTSASSLTTWVLINGQQVPLNAASQNGIFMTSATGEEGQGRGRGGEESTGKLMPQLRVDPISWCLPSPLVGR